MHTLCRLLKELATVFFSLNIFVSSYLIEVMTCCHCYNPIEPERLELIPNTHVCGGCARLFNVGKKKKGHMIFGHKTGAEIQVLSAETFESQKKYWTPNGARSAVKNFSKHICS
jgi:hypothetical protein